MKLERITIMPDPCPALREEPLEQTPGEQWVFDWVSDPAGVLAAIVDQWLKDPTDRCELGSVACLEFAQIDKERREWEEQLLEEEGDY